MKFVHEVHIWQRKMKWNDTTESHVHQQLSACNQFALESIRNQEYTKYLLLTKSVLKQK